MDDLRRSLSFLTAFGELVLSPLVLLTITVHERSAKCTAALRKYVPFIFAVSNACAAFDFAMPPPMIQRTLEGL